jgi:hypothetical protein
VIGFEGILERRHRRRLSKLSWMFGPVSCRHGWNRTTPSERTGRGAVLVMLGHSRFTGGGI